MAEGDAARPRRVLVIQHEDSAPGGYIDQWLEQRRAEEDVYRIGREQRELDPREYTMIVSLGSDLAAYDDSIPWLEEERELLQEATRADVPVLGICFGAQLLARVLGGSAFRSAVPEIGWRRLDSRDQAVISAGPWFQWHSDTFGPPPDSQLLADSAAGPQAYRRGRSLGVQFHPEVTPQIVEGWVAGYRGELDDQGVDPQRLMAETLARADRARAAAWRLFDGFAALASIGEAAMAPSDTPR